MNNHQAAHLRPGMLVRRKEPFERWGAPTEREDLIIERIELPTRTKDERTIYAGGFAFKAWEIERVRDADNRGMARMDDCKERT